MLKNLYETFAERWINNGSVWIYSDPHFADDEMKHLRKNYISDNEQVKRINSKVGKNDTLIFLGDIGDLSFIKKIHGYKVLIMGNHEKGASNYKRVINRIQTFNSTELSQEERLKIVANAEKIMKDPKLLDDLGFDKYFHMEVEDNHLFDEVYEGPLMINDRLILSHEPIENLPKYMFNIHGHDHSNWFSSDHHLNVCAEHIDYTPVNLLKLLKEGLLKNVDSIHRVTINAATERKAHRKHKKNKGNKADEVCNDSNK